MTYSPTLGRWAEVDPKRYVDGMNPYAFVKNNPINHTDAKGLATTQPSATQPSGGNATAIKVDTEPPLRIPEFVMGKLVTTDPKCVPFLVAVEIRPVDQAGLGKIGFRHASLVVRGLYNGKIVSARLQLLDKDKDGGWPTKRIEELDPDYLFGPTATPWTRVKTIPIERMKFGESPFRLLLALAELPFGKYVIDDNNCQTWVHLLLFRMGYQLALSAMFGKSRGPSWGYGWNVPGAPDNNPAIGAMAN